MNKRPLSFTVKGIADGRYVSNGAIFLVPK
jgi:hypothetical protein